MRSPSLVGLCTLALASCAASPATETKSTPTPEAAVTTGACDRAKVNTLVDTLGAADPRSRPDIVVASFGDACQTPPFLQSYFALSGRVGPGGPPVAAPTPTQWQDVLERACPNFQQMRASMATTAPGDRATLLFDGCKFDRFGIVEREAYLRRRPDNPLPFVAYQWLLEQKLVPEQALALSQAIELFDRREMGPVQPTPELELPAVSFPLEPVPVGVKVYVSRDSIRSDDQTLVTLDAGRSQPGDVERHLITKVYDRLAHEAEQGKQVAGMRMGQWHGRLVLIADEQTPYDTIVDLMYTAGRADFRQYAFVMDTGTFEYGVVPTSPPRFGSPEDAAPLMVTIDTAGFEIRDQGQPKPTPERIGVRSTLVNHDAWNFEALATRARAHRDKYVNARIAAVSPDGDIPYGVVVRALAALRGPDCGGQDDCALPDVVSGHSGVTRFKTLKDIMRERARSQSTQP